MILKITGTNERLKVLQWTDACYMIKRPTMMCLTMLKKEKKKKKKKKQKNRCAHIKYYAEEIQRMTV